MKGMVWHSVLLWLAAAGGVAGVTLLWVLFSGERMGLVIIPMSLGIFAVPLVSVASGIQAAAGRGSLGASLGAALLLGAFLLCFFTDGFRTSGMPWTLLAAVGPVLLLAGFCAARLTSAAKASASAAVRCGAPLLSLLLFCVLLYLTAALHSKAFFSPLPQRLFFCRPPNSAAVSVKTEGNRLRDASGEPFHGLVQSYRERLTLDFITKKVSGLTCYVDGYRFGSSGDAATEDRCGGWYAAGETGAQETAPEFYLHRAYRAAIEREFPSGEAVFYREVPANAETNPDSNRMPRITAVFFRPDRLERKEVSFHPNGVVSRIDTALCTKDGWDSSGESVLFDELGFPTGSGAQWREEDFIPARYSAYETIRASGGAFVPPESVRAVERMLYVPNPERWSYESRVDNIVAVYGLPLGTIYCYLKGPEGAWEPVSAGEGRDFLELLEKSRVIVGLLDDFHSVRSFQRAAREFRIVSKEDADRRFSLFYGDGRFLIGDGPYYLEPDAGGEGESGEDRRFREQLTERLAAMLERHTGAVDADTAE